MSEDELARRGLIPWSSKEFNGVIKRYMALCKKPDYIRKIDEQYAPFKALMARKTGSSPENFDKQLIISDILRQKYPDRTEFTAHNYRYFLIFRFLDKYSKELTEKAFIVLESGEMTLRPEFSDTLCTVSYSEINEDVSKEKKYGFIYKEIIDKTMARINTKLN